MMRGNLIVFEGIDGAGTTTQAAELRRRFTARGLPATVVAQPSGGPVGMLIRQILKGRLVTHGNKPPGWTTMSLLFAADRQDLQEFEIEPNLRDGVNVICDRYVPSSVVYQSVSAGGDEAVPWILDINRHIRPPDVIFYLRIDPLEAQRRRVDRSERPEIYDDIEMQRALSEAYDRVGAAFPDLEIVTIDGAQPVDRIADEAWAAVERIRARGAPR
jgi:dTMP kinase